jgi:hypothetical protein
MSANDSKNSKISDPTKEDGNDDGEEEPSKPINKKEVKKSNPLNSPPGWVAANDDDMSGFPDGR